MKLRSGLMMLVVLGTLLVSVAAAEEPAMLQLELRQRTAQANGVVDRVEMRPVRWAPQQTAIVICDMWNEHWCKGATRRVAEMADRMNQVVEAARRQGVLIIHCPSSCMAYYRDTPMRLLAEQAPKLKTERPLQSWCHLDPQQEAALPIDDSDGGCDCQPQCPTGSPWFRQIDTIKIHPSDAITDSAEAYYLMKQRGIENVIVMGVHTNMCVLGRPFSIRQMVYQGQNVVLMRDLTDTMYNPRMRPFVSHFAGTDLVVEHIERHWCPTITSDQIIGGAPFRFSNDHRKDLVMVIGEQEYHTQDTLPAFARQYLADDYRLHFVLADPKDPNRFPGIEVLPQADLAVLSIRRRALPADQLQVIQQYVAAGKPLVALRTSSHAFALREGQPPSGHAVWPEFDQQILGGNYQGHHNNKLPGDPPTYVRIASDASEHPVLRGVRQDEFQVASWLYQTSPLAAGATVLMTGRAGDRQPHEPVAWTHTSPAGGRVFYTSLGHPQDFKLPAFQRLLLNGIQWAAQVPTQAPAD